MPLTELPMWKASLQRILHSVIISEANCIKIFYKIFILIGSFISVSYPELLYEIVAEIFHLVYLRKHTPALSYPSLGTQHLLVLFLAFFSESSSILSPSFTCSRWPTRKQAPPHLGRLFYIWLIF